MTDDDLQQRERDEAIRAVLDSYHGRMFVWELLEDCGVFQASFTGEPPTTFFREGRRDIGLRLLERMWTVRSDALTTLRDEHLDRLARYHVKPQDKGTENE